MDSRLNLFTKIYFTNSVDSTEFISEKLDFASLLGIYASNFKRNLLIYLTRQFSCMTARGVPPTPRCHFQFISRFTSRATPSSVALPGALPVALQVFTSFSIGGRGYLSGAKSGFGFCSPRLGWQVQDRECPRSGMEGGLSSPRSEAPSPCEQTN